MRLYWSVFQFLSLPGLGWQWCIKVEFGRLQELVRGSICWSYRGLLQDRVWKIHKRKQYPWLHEKGRHFTQMIIVLCLIKLTKLYCSGWESPRWRGSSCTDVPAPNDSSAGKSKSKQPGFENCHITYITPIPAYFQVRDSVGQESCGGHLGRVSKSSQLW